MATESSVVVALREVRRLELERQKREEDSRMRAQEEEASRRSIQYEGGMSPYVNGNGHGANGQGWGGDGGPESYARPMRRTTEVVPLAANGYGEQQFVQTGPWDNALGAPTQRRRGGGFKAVLVTLVLCAGGAAAGYVKLKQEHGTQLSQMQADVQRNLDARAQAVADRSKAEQELKLRVVELEGKLALAQAKASSAAQAAAAAAAARAAAAAGTGEAVKAAPLPKSAAAVGRKPGPATRPAAKVAARPGPAVKEIKPAPLPGAPKSPKMAKKKTLSDDPLGGLRL